MAVELDEEYFPPDSGFLMLDIGPGAGGGSETYAQHRRVVAVERDQDLALAVAERSAPNQLSVCQGDAHQLPIGGASVDGVTLLEVLEHVDDPERVLAEAHRVLKPNGSICVAVPTSYTERVYSRLHPRYMRNATHVRIFKKSDLCHELRQRGFSEARVIAENFEPAVCWLIHSILRTEADATGRVLEHESVEPRVARAVARISATRGIGRALRFTQRHFGKSWYVYARKESLRLPIG